ncbi:DNA-binding protein HGH1 [Thecamonas trahens ATCC 50062]|uniref:Protein HGH1 homolog n=1 Tax=Thecamonas trahens ATCC 50062 TaxID=461836 RepID=A0A0L0D4R1_THETB|nr:DNA-binding protein HGH1 [Thecamonas trahens ATCC 50062]KNC46293.1 DNA-binding protein HGH1 [Thecamonas trahens ATCC 50062]|eukprot:XP_013760587.1 DNA-binding protein HGH1 [Thecamonas trahens ATCC 50062]
MDSNALLELVDFLNDPKAEVRAIAADHLAPYCDVPEARTVLLAKRKVLLERLGAMMGDLTPIAHNAMRALINLSAETGTEDSDKPSGRVGESWSRAMVQVGLVPRLLEVLLDPDAVISELAAMLLANCTRTEAAVHDLFDVWNTDSALEIAIVKLVRAFRLKHFHNPTLRSTFSPRLFLKKDGLLLAQLLPFLDDESVIRRGGILGTVRNLVYETDKHPLLLDPTGPINLLPKLLKPLMDNRVLEEDDVVGMPLEIRQLPYTHQRESDPELRRMIVDTLFYLSLEADSRQILLDSKVYVVVRNAHVDEEDEDASQAMFKLIDVLLPEIVKDDPLPGAPSASGALTELDHDLATAGPETTYVVGDDASDDDDDDILRNIQPLGLEAEPEADPTTAADPESESTAAAATDPALAPDDDSELDAEAVSMLDNNDDEDDVE